MNLATLLTAPCSAARVRLAQPLWARLARALCLCLSLVWASGAAQAQPLLAPAASAAAQQAPAASAAAQQAVLPANPAAAPAPAAPTLASPAAASAAAPTGPVRAAGPAPGGKPATPTAYTDKVIEGLAPLSESKPEASAYDSQGWMRGLRANLSAGQRPGAGAGKALMASSVQAWIDTPSYGSISLDAAWAPQASLRLTLRQRQMPLPRGWVAQHELGTVLMATPVVFTATSRVYTPVSLVQGLTGAWDQQAAGLSLTAGLGRPALLAGAWGADLQAQPGSRRSVGAQWHFTDWKQAWQALRDGASQTPSATIPKNRSAANLATGEASSTAHADKGLMVSQQAAGTLLGTTLGIRHEMANAAPMSAFADPATGVSSQGPALGSTQSTQLALRTQTRDWVVQTQMLSTSPIRIRPEALDGQAQSVTKTSSGLWVDSERREGDHRTTAGVFYLEPNLSWAGQPMSSDLTGMYIQHGVQMQRWAGELQWNWMRSVSKPPTQGNFVTANALWRLGVGRTAGVGASVRDFGGKGQQVFGDYRWQSALGATGARASWSHNTQGTETRMQWDQEWADIDAWSISSSASAGYASSIQPGASQKQRGLIWNAALAFQSSVGRAHYRGQVDLDRSATGTQRLSFNVNAAIRLSNQWSMDGQAIVSHMQQKQSLLDPLAAPSSTNSPSSSRSEQTIRLTLRYDLQAGSVVAPLGGRSLSGGGVLTGVVFMDANRSGAQEANEKGAEGVQVVLNERWSTRTNAQGRFEFPFVAAGKYRLRVRNDTLPLPWGTIEDIAWQGEVHLRQTTQVVIPVQRKD